MGFNTPQPNLLNVISQQIPPLPSELNLGEFLIEHATGLSGLSEHTFLSLGLVPNNLNKVKNKVTKYVCLKRKGKRNKLANL